MRYKVAIEESDEGFAVSVAGLPGCHSQGATEAEAIESIADAIREYLSVATEVQPGSMLTEEQKRELDRRLADLDANPDDVIPWEQVKAEALARFRQVTPAAETGAAPASPPGRARG